MSKIESGSEFQERKIGNFLVPSGAAVALYVLLGAVTILLFNYGVITGWLGSTYNNTAKSSSLSFNILNNSFSESFSSALGGRLGLIILWSFVGALAYVAVWFLRNILNSFENDIIIDHYLHPSSYDRKGYWGSAMSAKIFFGATAIILITYSVLAVNMVLPAAAALAANAAYHFKVPLSPGYILLSVLIAALCIYGWVLIFKTVRRLWALL
jgi:hypothetical protein